MKITQIELIFVVTICVMIFLDTTTAHKDFAVDAMKDFVELETYFDQKMKALSYKLKKRESEASCFAQGPNHVSFLAKLTMSGARLLSGNALVKFNEVIENVGKGFERYSSVFTAPVKGLYKFSSSVMEAKDGFLYLGLFKNDNMVVRAVSRKYVSLSINAAVILDKKDRVYIKNTRESTSKINGKGKSYWSGHLVKRLA